MPAATGGVKRKIAKGRACAGWKKLSSEEVRLAQSWYKDGVSPSEIATRLGRNKSSLTRLLVKKVERKRQGRPFALTMAKIDFLERRLHQLIVKADRRYEVTVTMLKRNTQVKATERTILNALHSRNIYFRAMRGKPVLTANDVKERFAFAKEYRGKTRAWWQKTLQGSIDGKFWSPALPGRANHFENGCCGVLPSYLRTTIGFCTPQKYIHDVSHQQCPPYYRRGIHKARLFNTRSGIPCSSM